jgi:hypothetical protein
LTGRFLPRLLFAVIGAVIALLGTLAGGAAYENTHPSYDRIVWVDRSGNDLNADRVIRRALFSDGRFISLTTKGYRAGVLDAAATTELFATASNATLDWHDDYPSAASLAELVDLEFQGSTSKTIRIANPTTNLTVPPALTRLLIVLGAADRRTPSIPFDVTSARVWAAPVQSTDGGPVDVLPGGLPLHEAASPDGVVIAGGELAVLKQLWTDLPSRFAPGLAHRFVEAEGSLWRLSWTIDLDAIGRLGAGVTP